MPNLRSLTLQCLRLYEEDYYKKLIEKILLLNLKNIDLHINSIFSMDIYSLKELKEIFPKINFYKFDNISIEKFNQIQFEEIKKSTLNFLKKKTFN